MLELIQGAAQFYNKVVETFSDIEGVVAIYADEPSNEEGRRGVRFTIVVDPKQETNHTHDIILVRCESLQEDNADFAWNLFYEGELDDHPRMKLWPREAGTVHVHDAAMSAFYELDPLVVAVSCAPADVVEKGEPVNVTVVARVGMGRPPWPLISKVNEATERLRREVPEVVEVQVAPELNFPPVGAMSEDDPLIELKAEVMRIVEPYRLVEAAWVRSQPLSVYIYGDDDMLLARKIKDLGVEVHFCLEMKAVPKDAVCVFNNITRLLKYQAEGDANGVNRIRAKIRAAAEKTQSMRPAVRGDPSTHFVHCRWCDITIPASSNPAHTDLCPECHASQAATMIPLKKEDTPVLALFINPDGSLFLELVGKPPVPGRLDLSPTRRYIIPASACQSFNTNPMGKRQTEEKPE